jgi:hypothetical protein
VAKRVKETKPAMRCLFGIKANVLHGDLLFSRHHLIFPQ